jgi:hypothetical protein
LQIRLDRDGIEGLSLKTLGDENDCE